jgi:hypothetical protein
MNKKLLLSLTTTALLFLSNISFSQTVNLGILESFEVYTASGGVTNSGGTVTGDVGTNFGIISGFPSPPYTGNTYNADAVTDQARFDLLRLYIHLADLSIDFPSASNPAHAPAFGSGETLGPGVYAIGGAGSIAGNLTLDGRDAEGDDDPNAVFVIKMNGAFTVGAGATVNLTGGTKSSNVFWLISGAISVAADADVKGTLFSKAGAVGLGANVKLEGRMLSMAGAITMGVGSSATPPPDPSTIEIFCEAKCTPAPDAAKILGGVLSDFTLFSSAGNVANTGITGIIGKIGTNAGAVTGYGGIVIGTEEIANALTAQAASDLDGAYSALMAMTPTVTTHPAAFLNETLTPGIYDISGAGSLGGVITLDAEGDPDAIFVFRFAGAFNVAAAAKIILDNGAKRCNVFWLGGAGVATGAVNIGASSEVKGTFMSHGGASNSGGGVFMAGRQLSTFGAVNTNTAVIYNNPQCVTSSSLNTPSFDHFQIEHDGQGLTCAPEEVTVKVCADTTCSTLYTDAIDVDLLINDTVDQTVTVVEGATGAKFSYTNTSTPATLSLNQPFKCKNVGSGSDPDSCEVVFTDAGFRFLYGAAETTFIGNQTSGNNFADIIKLQAVENVNGVCTGLFTGNVDVELSQQNIAPSGTTGLNFKVNGTSGTSIDKYPIYTPIITLDFGTESKATIPMPVYLDAGQIRLYAKYNVGGVSLVGNSNDFWVSPAKLVVTATADGSGIIGNSSSSAITHKAGQPFDFTVTAYNALGTSAANITTNYIPNDIQLLLTRTGPTPGGVNGTFSYGSGTISSDLTPSYQNVTLSAFNSGVSSTNTASYDEVGLLTLDLQDVDYGLSGNTITTDSLNIGRFTPDYFEQTVAEQGALVAVCNQTTTFAYTGQVMVSDTAKGAISYLANPVVELTAKNVQGVTVQNYTEPGYNKFIAAANFIIVPTTDSAIEGKDTNLLPLTANLLAGTLSHNGLVASASSFGDPLGAGILHYELASEDNFFYPRNENSEVIAQDNDIDFLIDQVNFVDSDGIGITNPVDITNTTSINLRFGRALIENSFGPETANLPQKLSMEYLNASGRYVVNEQDSCTSYDASNIILNSGTLDKNLTSVNAATGQLEKGETRAIILTAPSAGNQGTINIEYDIYSWLKYDWNWNGVDTKSFDENPTAKAAFGLFRGNDRIIHQGEVFD